MKECKPLAGGGVRGARGRAVQVDPIKPTLKAPGTRRFKLKCDVPLSNFAFNFSLRRYNAVRPLPPARSGRRDKTVREAGADTRSLQSST